MPRITHLLNKQIFLTRMVDLGNDKSAYATTTAAMSHIQPATNSARSIAEGVFGKQFKIYVDGGLDVEEGDQVRDEDGNRYTVISDGVSHRQFGTFDYKILVVEKTRK